MSNGGLLAGIGGIIRLTPEGIKFNEVSFDLDLNDVKQQLKSGHLYIGNALTIRCVDNSDLDLGARGVLVCPTEKGKPVLVSYVQFIRELDGLIAA